METVYQLCNFNLFGDYSFGNDTANVSFSDDLKEISLSLEDVFFYCTWGNNLTKCESFTPILTEEGFCFTFNSLNASEIYRSSALHTGYEYPSHEMKSYYWTLENGYAPEAPLETYPQRALGDGVRAGLYIWMKLAEKNFDYMCRASMQGFKVQLHSPDDVPHVSQQYFRVPLNKEITVTVKPSMLTTSNRLRIYDPVR